MNPKTDAKQNRRPHLAYVVATGLGVGYLPKAPGTFGSLLSLPIAWVAWAIADIFTNGMLPDDLVSASRAFFLVIGVSAFLVSLVGIWAAGRVAKHLQKKDPQLVVVDEVAGQLISYLGLASGPVFAPSWQYLLAGFILFRVFDIWKPFPARQAESLPGGLGIMADDWVAGVYAALVLALARQLGF